jgi:Tol biopolymer transport system component
MKRPLMLTVCAGLLGAVAVVVGLAHPPVAHSAFPGRIGKIAFWGAPRAAKASIYTIHPDGTHRKRLTPVPTSETNQAYDPAFSADAKKIAYERVVGTPQNPNYEIYKMRANGSRKVRLTDTQAREGNPAFSPNGRRIVFDRGPSGGYEIFSMRVDGSDERRLTNSPAGDVAPTFSPGGERIAFGRNSNLAIMRADGRRLHRITKGAALDNNPGFSPNGRWIVFDRSTNRGSSYQIYAIRANGTHLRRLTKPIFGVDDGNPVFSPNGKKIAFQSDGRHGIGPRIYVMRRDGTHIRRLHTGTHLGAFAPSWGVRP